MSRLSGRILPNLAQRRLGLVAALLFGAVLLAMALLFVDPGDPPHILLFLGRFHPVIVHFPIGLIVLAGLLEGLSFVRPLHGLREVVSFVLLLGLVGAVAAVIAGFFLSLEGGYDEALISTHKWLGFAVAAGAVGAMVLRMRERRRPSTVLYSAYAGVLAMTVVALLVTGHIGGSLTHGPGYLTYYLPGPLKALVGMENGGELAGGIQNVDSAIVYTDLVAPVLDARCVSCHSASKEKGGLRLDSFEGLMQGGDHGAVVVAGSPEESEIWRRITLPPEHEDLMPPDGAEPLPIGETEVLRWWIVNGASAEIRVAEIEEIPHSVATLLSRVAPPRAEKRTGLYALEVPPPDAQALAAVRAAGIDVSPIANDLPFLQVNAVNDMETIGDAELKQLLPLAPQITWIDLTGTRIGDDGLATLAQMPHLTRVYLAQTEIGDEGLEHLAGLTHLEHLNLYGTRVTDAGLEQLRELKRLQAVYLWQTAVSEEGVAELRSALPEAQIELGAAPAEGSTRREVPSESDGGGEGKGGPVADGLR